MEKHINWSHCSQTLDRRLFWFVHMTTKPINWLPLQRLAPERASCVRHRRRRRLVRARAQPNCVRQMRASCTRRRILREICAVASRANKFGEMQRAANGMGHARRSDVKEPKGRRIKVSEAPLNFRTVRSRLTFY